MDPEADEERKPISLGADVVTEYDVKAQAQPKIYTVNGGRERERCGSEGCSSLFHMPSDDFKVKVDLYLFCLMC